MPFVNHWFELLRIKLGKTYLVPLTTFLEEPGATSQVKVNNNLMPPPPSSRSSPLSSLLLAPLLPRLSSRLSSSLPPATFTLYGCGI